MGLSREKAIERILKTPDEEKPVLIQADAPGYAEPEKLSFYGGYNNKKYTPDVVINYENHVDFFSIESAINKKVLSDALPKWILFSTAAKKKNGMFYLVVDDGKRDAFQEVINSKQITARVIGI